MRRNRTQPGAALDLAPPASRRNDASTAVFALPSHSRLLSMPSEEGSDSSSDEDSRSLRSWAPTSLNNAAVLQAPQRCWKALPLTCRFLRPSEVVRLRAVSRGAYHAVHRHGGLLRSVSSSLASPQELRKFFAFALHSLPPVPDSVRHRLAGYLNEYSAFEDMPPDEQPDGVLGEILRDIPRTCSVSQLFAPTAQGRAVLFAVLRGFARLRPKVGYCQGMNFVAGLLITMQWRAAASPPPSRAWLHSAAAKSFAPQRAVPGRLRRQLRSTPSPRSAAAEAAPGDDNEGSDNNAVTAATGATPWLDVAVNTLHMLLGFADRFDMGQVWGDALVRMRLLSFQFLQLLKKHLPALASHLNVCGFSPDILVAQWWIPLLTTLLPANVTLAVWSAVFVKGWSAAFQCVLGALNRLKPCLLALDIGGISRVLRDIKEACLLSMAAYPALPEALQQGTTASSQALCILSLYGQRPSLLFQDAEAFPVSNAELHALEKDFACTGVRLRLNVAPEIVFHRRSASGSSLPDSKEDDAALVPSPRLPPPTASASAPSSSPVSPSSSSWSSSSSSVSSKLSQLLLLALHLDRQGASGEQYGLRASLPPNLRSIIDKQPLLRPSQAQRFVVERFPLTGQPPPYLPRLPRLRECLRRLSEAADADADAGVVEETRDATEAGGSDEQPQSSRSTDAKHGILGRIWRLFRPSPRESPRPAAEDGKEKGKGKETDKCQEKEKEPGSVSVPDAQCQAEEAIREVPGASGACHSADAGDEASSTAALSCASAAEKETAPLEGSDGRGPRSSDALPGTILRRQSSGRKGRRFSQQRPQPRVTALGTKEWLHQRAEQGVGVLDLLEELQNRLAAVEAPRQGDIASLVGKVDKLARLLPLARREEEEAKREQVLHSQRLGRYLRFKKRLTRKMYTIAVTGSKIAEVQVEGSPEASPPATGDAAGDMEGAEGAHSSQFARGSPRSSIISESSGNDMVLHRADSEVDPDAPWEPRPSTDADFTTYSMNSDMEDQVVTLLPPRDLATTEDSVPSVEWRDTDDSQAGYGYESSSDNASVRTVAMAFPTRGSSKKIATMRKTLAEVEATIKKEAREWKRRVWRATLASTRVEELELAKSATMAQLQEVGNQIAREQEQILLDVWRAAMS